VALYLGLDSSTQSLTAVVIDASGDRRRVICSRSFSFDAALPQYRTRHGVLPHDDPRTATSSPLMWAEALELMMNQLRDDIDVQQIAAISGSAQQHGSVYLNRHAGTTLAALDPARPLVDQVRPILSRNDAPIWMDSSTTEECHEITDAVGGEATLAHRTGSRAFERFTGPQIRRFSKRAPAAYAATERIHLVSSFLASLLGGRHAPVDVGDGSGMNLMDLRAHQWWPEALDATAPGLATKLPPVADSWTSIGRLAPYWQTRYGYPPAHVIAWSGDNPCSLIGTGLVTEGRVAVSMGTSDTVFGLMNDARIDDSGIGHVFGSPTGAYMGLTVFQNGSLARERVRADYGMSWLEFSQALTHTLPTAGGIMLPWFEPEITPAVAIPRVHRYAEGSGPATIRALVESQQLAMAIHSSWMGVRVHTIHATGGAAANREILQIMADVFGADVFQLEVANSAALGAALRALHAHAVAEARPVGWEEIVSGFAEPVAASRITPDSNRHELYREWRRIYQICEAHALGRGPAPDDAIAQFRRVFSQPPDQSVDRS
jgi:xylulokinase